MSTTSAKLNVDSTREYLVQLGCAHAAEEIDTLLAAAVKKETAPHAFLHQVLSAELAGREERRIKTSLRLSGLPTGQTLASFDFAFQPAIERSRIETLATSGWVQGCETVLLQGPPGVGKTHLAIALGVKAVEQGFSAQFLRFDELLTQLKRDAHLPPSKLRRKKVPLDSASDYRRTRIRDHGPAVVAAGDFSSAGSTFSRYVARWDGSQWSTFGAGTEFDPLDNPYIFEMESVSADSFFLGGRFTQVGQISASNLVRFDFTKVDPEFTGGQEQPDGEQRNNAEVSVYPNPGLADLSHHSIGLAQSDRLTVQIYDLLGRLRGNVWTQKEVDAGSHEISLSGFPLTAGAYWITIQGERTNATVSWVVPR